MLTFSDLRRSLTAKALPGLLVLGYIFGAACAAAQRRRRLVGEGWTNLAGPFATGMEANAR